MADIRCGGFAAPPFETYDRVLCNEIRWLVDLRMGEGPARILEPSVAFPEFIARIRALLEASA
jgi:hypothetical protein